MIILCRIIQNMLKAGGVKSLFIALIQIQNEKYINLKTANAYKNAFAVFGL